MSIKLFELFAGIGAIRKAFINSQIPFECVGISEIDKFAKKYGSTVFVRGLCMSLINKLEIEHVSVKER